MYDPIDLFITSWYKCKLDKLIGKTVTLVLIASDHIK